MIHLNTKEFSYDKVSQSFTAEASTLEHEHADLFDHDTIELQSHKSGSFKTFKHSHTEKDREGDILYWEYKSSDSLRIKIFND